MFNTLLSFSFALVMLCATLGGCATTDSEADESQTAAVTAAASFTLTVTGQQAMEVNSTTSGNTCIGCGLEVISAMGGYTCLTCGLVFAAGTPVTVDALDDNTGCLVFNHWSGACAGQGQTCSLVINSDLSTDAVYHLNGVGCH